MSLKIRFWIALACVVGLSGCSLTGESPLVEMEPADDDYERQFPRSEYDSVWAAVEAFDIFTLPVLDTAAMWPDFLDGIVHTARGSAEFATLEFELALENSTDTLEQLSAFKLLLQFHLMQFEWRKLLDLVDRYPDLAAIAEIDSCDVIFARAMLEQPEERYVMLLDTVRAPMGTILTGTPTVEVVINGKKKTFVLDTGASLSVLASDFAEEAGVRPLGDYVCDGTTSTSITIDASPAVIDKLEIGDLTIHNHPVAIVNAEDLTFKLFDLITILKVDGIIGWPLFRELAVQFDYPNETLTLYKSDHEGPPTNFYWSGYPMVRLYTKDGTLLNFGLDTGADQTSIKRRLIDRLNLPVDHEEMEEIGGAGGTEAYLTAYVDSLTLYFADHRLTFNQISTTPGVQSALLVEPDGKMGIDIFQDRRVLFDYRNGRVEVFD